MGFQWKQIIPFLSSLSTFLPPKQCCMTTRAAAEVAGRAAPMHAGGDEAPSSGGFPMYPVWLEGEQKWQERGGGRASSGHRAVMVNGQHKELSEQQGLVLATAANGDGKGWRGKDATQLVPFGFDLESRGVLATEQEGGRRRVTHKNIAVSMKMQLPEDRKEEGTSLQTWGELEEKVPLVWKLPARLGTQSCLLRSQRVGYLL